MKKINIHENIYAWMQKVTDNDYSRITKLQEKALVLQYPAEVIWMAQRKFKKALDRLLKCGA